MRSGSACIAPLLEFNHSEFEHVKLESQFVELVLDVGTLDIGLGGGELIIPPVTVQGSSAEPESRLL